jgi:osmotically-inducible protein OsmY
VRTSITWRPLSIDVDTNRCVVSLNGMVESVAAKQKAEDIARTTSGVKKVVKNLQISARQ